jgi:endonuclease YncB( thermonuclease family)
MKSQQHPTTTARRFRGPLSSHALIRCPRRLAYLTRLLQQRRRWAKKPMHAVALISLLLLASMAHADPVAPADVYVVDGDTIMVQGKRIRLVGFDAPELGGHAHCGLERMLAARATSRLRQLVRTGGDLDLELIPCSCRPGTEGTMACNYGRACGVLTVEGEDVGDVLMAANLAYPYVCAVFVPEAAVVVPAGSGRTGARNRIGWRLMHRDGLSDCAWT